jgi:hypothetical protein
LSLFALLLLLLPLQGALRPVSIEGYVVRAGTEPPFPLVNARLELSAGRENFVARTDSIGRFVFSGVPAGRYRLRVTKDGFIRQEYPHAAMDTPGLLIDLAAGQQMTNVVFEMEPAWTISGAIRDPRNAPLAAAIIQALKRGFDARGNRSLALVASTRTDDKGSYRLYWLDPGEYFISAIPPSRPPSPGEPIAEQTVALAPSYYPGFPALDDAKAITFGSGRDANGVDFSVSQQRMGPVRGSVISVTTGRPVAATVILSAAEDQANVARFQTRSVAQPPPPNRNNYSIPGVPPGSYILSATSGEERAARRILVRAGGLVSDLELGTGVAIRGRVVPMLDSADLRTTRVSLEEIDTALPAPAEATVAQDGSFTVSAVQPGYYSVSATGLPGDLYIKSANFVGIDVLEKSLPVAYGSPSENAELTLQLGLDGGRIGGAVFDSADKRFAGAHITLIPESEGRILLDRYRTSISLQDGSFSIRGIAPGDYKLFAWANPESNAYLNREYMRSYEMLGTPVHIEPGQNPPVSLRTIRIGN